MALGRQKKNKNNQIKITTKIIKILFFFKSRFSSGLSRLSWSVKRGEGCYFFLAYRPRRRAGRAFGARDSLSAPSWTEKKIEKIMKKKKNQTIVNVSHERETVRREIPIKRGAVGASTEKAGTVTVLSSRSLSFSLFSGTSDGVG